MSFYRGFNANIALQAWNAAPRAACQTFRLTRFSPVIGAEVEGVDHGPQA